MTEPKLPNNLRTSGESPLQFHIMRVPDLDVTSNSPFLNFLALFYTDYSLISKQFIALFLYIIKPRLKTSFDTAI